MTNRPISVFLRSNGISGANEQAIARGVLEDAGFTRPGKVNMAVDKEARARERLESALAFHCADAVCREALSRNAHQESNPRQPLMVERDFCEICGGSADGRELRAMANSMEKAGLSRIVVVGGTKQKETAILRMSPETVQWRFVNDFKRVDERDAAADLKWADVIVIWARTPLKHRVSNLYSRAEHAVIAPTTGIGQLARTAREFAQGGPGAARPDPAAPRGQRKSG